MAASGITVLKNNVPWGPFTREQIDHGLSRGDFTLKFLAYASGLKEWTPLGEVIDYVDKTAGAHAPYLPPLPGPVELPPIPESPAIKVELPSSKPTFPPILPAPVQRTAEKRGPPSIPLIDKPVTRPEVQLTPVSFFPRAIAFAIDFAILFVPVGLIFLLGALGIEFSAWWHHSNHQTVIEEWDLLEHNTKNLVFLVTVGFGWLYVAGLEASRSQATIGKKWMGMKVTDAQGERISFVRATGRYAAKYLSAFPCFLGFMMALLGSRGRTLHDRLADTRVVKR
jgi:uncharacterized RDD family membrane protein YckC